MKKHKPRPAVITALKSKAHLIRQVALEQGISFDETPVTGEDDVIRFSFKPMDDATSHKLVMAIPRDAFARRAVIGGGPPPGVFKKAP
jgi:hypothetical protein